MGHSTRCGEWRASMAITSANKPGGEYTVKLAAGCAMNRPLHVEIILILSKHRATIKVTKHRYALWIFACRFILKFRVFDSSLRIRNFLAVSRFRLTCLSSYVCFCFHWICRPSPSCEKPNEPNWKYSRNLQLLLLSRTNFSIGLMLLVINIGLVNLGIVINRRLVGINRNV